MEAINNPEDAIAGTRTVPFSKVLYIEQDDFREDPPKQYFRLSHGREVRLRYGYFITCTGVVKDASGAVVEIHCTYDPATHGGNAPDGRKVKSTIHWVSADHAIDSDFAQHAVVVEKNAAIGRDQKRAVGKPLVARNADDDRAEQQMSAGVAREIAERRQHRMRGFFARLLAPCGALRLDPRVCPPPPPPRAR